MSALLQRLRAERSSGEAAAREAAERSRLQACALRTEVVAEEEASEAQRSRVQQVTAELEEAEDRCRAVKAGHRAVARAAVAAAVEDALVGLQRLAVARGRLLRRALIAWRGVLLTPVAEMSRLDARVLRTKADQADCLTAQERAEAEAAEACAARAEDEAATLKARLAEAAEDRGPDGLAELQTSLEETTSEVADARAEVAHRQALCAALTASGDVDKELEKERVRHEQNLIAEIHRLKDKSADLAKRRDALQAEVGRLSVRRRPSARGPPRHPRAGSALR